jgi:hypothetical protein
MPANFHSVKHHSKIIKKYFQSGALFTSSNDEVVDVRYLRCACLGIGLAIRDINTVQFRDPDDESDIPDFISNSDLTLMHLTPLLEACETIVDLVEVASSHEDRCVFFALISYSLDSINLQLV